MQKNTLQIRDRLLTGLDKEYNVVNSKVVVEVLSQLEAIQITKEALEATRLGKHINELRRKTTDRQIAARAKSLVKKWRNTFVQNSTSTPVANGGEPPPGGGVLSTPSAPTKMVNGDASRLEYSKLASSQQPLRQKVSHLTSRVAAPSSLPSSASTSPGLSSSRPTTPNSRQGVKSQPVSPAKNGIHQWNSNYIGNGKRPRPADSEGSDVDVVGVDAETPAKRPRVNGKIHHDPAATADQLMGSRNHCDKPLVMDSRPPPGRRKTRGQRTTTPLDQTDALKQQMQNVRRVRTTQELVQELAMMRSTSPGLPTSNRSSLEDATPAAVAASSAATAASGSSSVVEETREELMSRFFDSQDAKNSALSPPTSLGVPSPPSDTSTKKETVEDVMAKLPPINVQAVLADMAREAALISDDEEDDGADIPGLIPAKKPEPVAVTDEMVAKLNEGQEESFNGNFSHEGEFKEWHEVVTKSSVGDDVLYILPYSVID